MKKMLGIWLFVSVVTFSWAQPAQRDSRPGTASDKTKSTAVVLSQILDQLAQQQREIEALKAQLAARGEDAVSARSLASDAKIAADKASSKADAASQQSSSAQEAVSSVRADLVEVKTDAAKSLLAVQEQRKHITDLESPLQFRLGSAYVTPFGFMDFTSVWRDHAGGSGIGTNFASMPYGSTPFQNHLSEFRLSAQNSRIGFRVDAKVKDARVIGYMEADFLGNNPGNVAVSSNSNTMRSRLYWMDLRRNRWEVLVGQSWSLITPGRSGISPLPANLFYTQNVDVNYQVGLVWGRIPELRVVYHPSEKIAVAVALDNPEQYAGGSAGGSLVTFPAALASTYLGGETNNGSSSLGVPNRAPDVIAKVALDPSPKFHFEAGGVMRQFSLWNPNTSTRYSATGGGGFVNLNFALFKGFRVLTNNFWSDGGGRYIFGQAPDLIARVDGSPSLLHSGSTVTGVEYTRKNTLVYSYYGGLYVGRNFVIDTNGRPVGYGYVGSPTGQNRAIQEATFGTAQTLAKDPKYGALTFMAQYSYVTRNPWSVAAGQPSNADMNLLFFNLRYTLPGSAPALK